MGPLTNNHPAITRLLLDADWLCARISEAPRPTAPKNGAIKRASVFFTLFAKKNAPHLLTVLKTNTEGYPWRNQVALPGGHVDKKDRDALETAYRELKEEIGIDAGNIQVAGSLGDFPTIADTVIEAFVAVWNGNRQQLACDPKEIERLIEVPIQALRVTHASKGFSKREPAVGELLYPYNDVVIWGVTARIIHFFLEHIDA